MDIDKVNNEAPQWSSLKSLTFVAAFILAPLTAWTTGLIGPGNPTAISPLPIPWILLTFIFGQALPALPVGLFWLRGWPLFYGKPTGRRRTRVAAPAISILSFIWFYVAWNDGLKHQRPFTLVTAGGSFAFAAAIGAILASSKRADSFKMESGR